MPTLLIVTTVTTDYSVTDDTGPERTTAVEDAPTTDLLSIDEVAAYLRMSPRWVYDQVRGGRLPAMLAWRIRRAALEEFADEFRVGKRGGR